LKYLLPSDILQPPIQIPHLLSNLAHLPLIRTLNRACLSDGQIHRQFDLPLPLPTAQPAAGGVAGGREADAVVAGVCGAEGEFSGMGASGIHDAVVVVEDFVDSDGYGHLRVLDVVVGLGVVLESGVVA